MQFVLRTTYLRMGLLLVLIEVHFKASHAFLHRRSNRRLQAPGRHGICCGMTDAHEMIRTCWWRFF
jgi:hypothetical protein